MPEEIFVEDSEVEDEVGETVHASSISKSPSPRRQLKTSPPSKAARLPYFKQAWQQVTSNNFILNIVINGYKIQFNSVPVQINYQPRSISSKNEKICKDKVKKFLKFKIIKVISPNHDQIEFISHIFPVPKRSPGEYRIIFDLTDLNLFVRKSILKWIVFQI